MIPPKTLKDKINFQKLNVGSYIELALIAPVRYEDFNVYKFPKINEFNVVEISIDKIQKYPKFLKVYAKAWDKDVEIIIFNPTSFHFSNFRVTNKFFVRAKVEYSLNKLQLLQPKIAYETGRVLPIYKTSVAQKSMVSLINEYLDVKNLEDEGLPKTYAKALCDLHNPLCADYDSALKNALEALKFGEIYIFLKRLSHKKQHFEASAVLMGDEQEFVKSLPFSLTDEQIKAIRDIKGDLSKSIAARRVIMGDVGSGKTVVIFAAVMMAMPKCSVLMVPTTILAKQIFDEAKRLLPPNVRSVLVASGDKDDTCLEKADFIIGTHVLLYRKLPKCDLVMIDEQHRFGTAQRDAVHKMVSERKEHPHFLQFSATPIPRTMSLIHSSIVNYSFIKQTPYKKDVDTYIIGKNDFGKMLWHIENEIKEGRQTIIIYPLIEESEAYKYQSIDEGRAFWENRYKNVYVTHGKDKSKELTLEEFNKNGSILLATTVVEVGISLPKLSTIVIVGAEHLGLATLHQLRGRVSRNGLKGYCYLYTNMSKNKRLLEFANTKNGFDIAELDLKYRQSGDLLSGIFQHGVQFRWFSLKDDKDILIKAQKLIR
ncbi:MAG: ATP-dependent DNA helicase RecG [Campylobacteraceae bacterium]|jgi:ATP-dependent DNA helicase RecG|nr:ATP-dependent DNA helicase RecG [Campylobacteraceae bacterium]